MSQRAELYSALQKADAAGDADAAHKLAAYIRALPKEQNVEPEKYNPADDYDSTLQIANPFGKNIDTRIPLGHGTQNFLAGAGKASTDIVRGVGQVLGLKSRDDVAESRRLDAPLMATGAGKAGMVAGTVVDMLPAAFIPGANTLTGAAAIGAGSGVLQPSTSTRETLTNTALGATLSPAALLAGRGIGALYQGGKAAIEPLFKGGQERVAARAFKAFAGGEGPAQDALRNISNAGPVLPGVAPTTAELANNAGLAQLERSLRNNPEYLTAMTNRNQANRGAMTTALQGIAGSDADMAAAHAARSAASSPLYEEAGSALAPIDDGLKKLLSRPSIKSAWQRAERLAAERGESLSVNGARTAEDIQKELTSLSNRAASMPENLPLDAPEMKAFETRYAQLKSELQNAGSEKVSAPGITGRTIQYLKMAMNDIANTASQSGMGSHEASAIKSTLGELNNWTQQSVPTLRTADQTYASLSKPINQMEVGQALSNKLLPPLADFGNNTRLNANTFAKALRDGDQLAANVTGHKSSTLENVLTPSQMDTVKKIGEQLARRANADELGKAFGSNTGQNLISQNVLRQILGPLGLPQSMSERAAQSTFGQSVLRPVQFLAKAGEPKVMDKLAEASLSTKLAKQLLQQRIDPKLAQAIWARQGLLGSAGVSVANSSQQ